MNWNVHFLKSGRRVRIPNPKGIVSSSQGLRGTSYPGNQINPGTTPTGLRPFTNTPATTPLGLQKSFTDVPQGSSCLATLDFGSESLWDSAHAAKSRWPAGQCAQRIKSNSIPQANERTNSDAAREKCRKFISPG